MRCDCVADVNDADKHEKNLVMESAGAKPTVIPQTFNPLTRSRRTNSVPELLDPLMYEVLKADTTGVHLACGRSSP